MSNDDRTILSRTGLTPTRRRVLGGMSAAGILAAMPTGFAGTAKASEPRQGGQLRVGLSRGSSTDSLDPATYANSFSDTLGTTFNSTLTEIDASGNVVPELAESWDVDAVAKRWVFKIRKGAEFHNGKTITPEDVVASVNHHRGEKSTSAVKPFTEIIKDIVVDGDNVVFSLTDGNADFPISSGISISRSFPRRTARSTGTLAPVLEPTRLQNFSRARAHR